MPVKITFGKTKLSSGAAATAPQGAQKPSEALKGALTPTKAPQAPKTAQKASKTVDYDLSNAETIGDFKILGALSLDPPKEGRLFIVHKVKPGIWYEVLDHNDIEGTLKLRSVHGTVFDSKSTLTEVQFYASVIAPKERTEPLPDVLTHIQGTLVD